jgi:hypothetical protein
VIDVTAAFGAPVRIFLSGSGETIMELIEVLFALMLVSVLIEYCFQNPATLKGRRRKRQLAGDVDQQVSSM